VLCLLIVFSSCNNGGRAKKHSNVSKDSFYSSSQTFKPFSQKFTDSLEQFFESGFSGTVLVYKKGRLYKKAFGYRDLNKSSAMQVDDVFQLASVSKTVTAAAVMLLVQDGKIQLDSPAIKYLPDFPYPKVSVRQLLSHRSGLANYIYYTDTFWKDTSKYMDNKAFYQFMVKNKPVPYLDPDVSFSYCNTNYAFLAVLIEKISGLSFPEFVEERIFKPCGMRNSFFQGHQPARVKSKVLVGRYDRYEYYGTYYLDGVLGDKSLYSNVEDLFGFHLALSEGRLINRKLLKQMSEPSYDYNVFGGSYGLGFRLMNTANGQWTYHNGWWRGFWTSFWNKFDKQTCFVILTNNKHSSHINKLGFANFLLQNDK
jgi:CubicO group peptidase (beta-lactamase class C family)